MSSSLVNLNRTLKNKIVLYPTDGFGRDAYITYNDGGFWKDVNIKKLLLNKNYSKKNNYKVFHSLNHRPAPFNYYNDGTGRDGYIADKNGGLVSEFSPLAKKDLGTFLRQDKEYDGIKKKLFFSKADRKILLNYKKIEDNVIKRLYRNPIKYRNKNSFKNDCYLNKNFMSISPKNSYNNIEFSLNRENNNFSCFSERKDYKCNKNKNNRYISPYLAEERKSYYNNKIPNIFNYNSNQKKSYYPKQNTYK